MRKRNLELVRAAQLSCKRSTDLVNDGYDSGSAGTSLHQLRAGDG